MPGALVVDDSPIELMMGKTLLERLGVSVWTASTGQEALRLIQEHAPEIVLSDITMPGMSGLELLEATRHLEMPPIFIMASSLDDAEHAVASLERGAYGYLTKPLKEAPLTKAIHEARLKRNKELAARRERQELASTDPLTGLFNKDEFIRALKRYICSLRKGESPAALLFVNVDGLRYINNTYGPDKGDFALQHVALNLKNCVRPSDPVARFGGDVFAVLLSGIEEHNVDVKAQSILTAIERARISLNGREHSLTVTIGIALGSPGVELEDFINNADFALMLAKRVGRNCFHLYREEDSAHRREFGAQLNSIDLLKDAIENKRFEMYYQPIVSLRDGGVKHYEALIRLRDGQGNILPPDVFIKTAESFGLANKIDRMVVAACIGKLAELGQERADVSVAINLSGKSVGDADLLEVIRGELAGSKVDPARVIFEITETAAFYNLPKVQEFVRQVKALGCRFALDDFGVGFSSFYYIKQLDIDYLKIDGSFIRNLCTSPNDQVFVRAMVEISRVFGMQVIAEWVESEAVGAVLKDMGVDYGQGYHFGKPLPKLLDR
jgi:diguanylate cyclase (GGDEF)-like protein